MLSYNTWIILKTLEEDRKQAPGRRLVFSQTSLSPMFFKFPASGMDDFTPRFKHKHGTRTEHVIINHVLYGTFKHKEIRRLTKTNWTLHMLCMLTRTSCAWRVLVCAWPKLLWQSRNLSNPTALLGTSVSRVEVNDYKNILWCCKGRPALMRKMNCDRKTSLNCSEVWKIFVYNVWQHVNLNQKGYLYGVRFRFFRHCNNLGQNFRVCKHNLF